MLHSKSRLLGAGVAVAAVVGVGALTYAAVGAGRTLPRLAAERGHVMAAAEAGEPAQDCMAQAGSRKDVAPAPKRDVLPPPRDGAAQSKAPPQARTDERAATSREASRSNRDVRVRAPNTDVDVDRDSGKVRVRAPYTKVDVNPDRGQVRVRAPYVNLDIRW